MKLEPPIDIEWPEDQRRKMIEEEYVESSEAAKRAFDRKDGHLVIEGTSEAEEILEILFGATQELTGSARRKVSMVRLLITDKLDRRGLDLYPEPDGSYTIGDSYEYCMVCSPPPDAYSRIRMGDEVFCADHEKKDLRRQLRALDERTDDHKPIGAEGVEHG